MGNRIFRLQFWRSNSYPACYCSYCNNIQGNTGTENFINQVNSNVVKKINIVVLAVFLSFAFYPAQSNAAISAKPGPITVVFTHTADQVKVKKLESRLNAINKMDKSDLKFAEKRELRREVRSIKEQLNELGGGLLLSVGAIVVIVFLLIILL